MFVKKNNKIEKGEGSKVRMVEKNCNIIFSEDYNRYQ